MKAAKYGYDDIVRILVEKETGMQDGDKWTALMFAAKYGHLECVKFLLDFEAGMQDNDGKTAMMQ